MGRVEAFRLEGIECWFYSQDHRPPHFHARRRGQWEVRVFFLKDGAEMIERVQGLRGRISARHLNALCRRAERFREKLLIEWEHKVVQ